MAKLKGTSFSGKRAYEHLEHLAVKIGPRLTGSAGEHKAARYIEKTFKAFGLRTRLQRFPVTTYDSRKSVFSVKDGAAWRRVKWVWGAGCRVSGVKAKKGKAKRGQ